MRKCNEVSFWILTCEGGTCEDSHDLGANGRQDAQRSSKYSIHCLIVHILAVVDRKTACNWLKAEASWCTFMLPSVATVTAFHGCSLLSALPWLRGLRMRHFQWSRPHRQNNPVMAVRVLAHPKRNPSSLGSALRHSVLLFKMCRAAIERDTASPEWEFNVGRRDDATNRSVQSYHVYDLKEFSLQFDVLFFAWIVK